MFRRRRTLTIMEQDRLIALICDVALEQGGEAAETMAVLRNQLSGEDLEKAELLAVWVIGNYQEPGLGPEVVRAMRDRRRRLVPAQPMTAGRWRGWGRTG
jgi:hypothetical protein